jgi:hypothetical protein
MEAPAATALVLVDLVRSCRAAGYSACAEQLGSHVLVGTLPGNDDPWAYRTTRVRTPGGTQVSNLQELRDSLQMHMQVWAVKKGADQTARNQVLIGRSTGTDVVLSHPSVSKLHARISLNPEGAVLQDAGSANGTFANGEQVNTPRYSIKNGDRIRFGQVELVFLATASLVEMLAARTR